MSAKLARTGVAMAALLVLGLTGGCAQIRDHKGYVVDSALLETVKPGIDNRDSVTRTLGQPSFASQFDRGQNWYYLARDTRQLAFGNPRPVAQTLLTVRFDAAGNVVGVEKTGVETIASISPDGDKTPTLGSKRGFLSELFGNIGRVGGAGSGSAGGTADNPN